MLRAGDATAAGGPDIGAQELVDRADVEEARGALHGARLAAPCQDLIGRGDERIVALVEPFRGFDPRRLRGFGRGLASLGLPDREPAIEEVDSLARETVQAHDPIAADRLAVVAVVVEDDALTRRDAPRRQRGGHVLTRRHEVLPPGRAGFRPRAGSGQIHVHVHEDGAGQMRRVVDLAVERDVDEPQVRVVKVSRQPLGRHQGSSFASVHSVPPGSCHGYDAASVLRASCDGGAGPRHTRTMPLPPGSRPSRRRAARPGATRARHAQRHSPPSASPGSP